MKKIPTLFVRDMTTRQVVDQVNEGCEWVLAGEGVATRKLDGTCCMVRDGKLYKRYEVKPGGTPPPNFEPANEIDENTGKQQGWLPVGDGPEDKWHREAFSTGLYNDNDGTYELVGPKVQGNPDNYERHHLIPHGFFREPNAPRTFAELREYLANRQIDGVARRYIEGIVWHHPDGRMAKLKRRDFGLAWPVRK